MSLLTPEESKRAWNRILRHRVGPIIVGMCSGSLVVSNGGSVVHMARGLKGISEEADRLGYHDLGYIAERAASMVASRIFVTRKEVETFIHRNLQPPKENQ